MGQSVADAARKERARQRQLESTGTYTNAGASVAVAAASSGTTASVTPAPSSTVTDNKGRDEKFWRGAFQKAREEAKRADDKVQILEMNIRDMKALILQRSDIYNRENVIGAQITAAEAELETARKDAELANKKIADLEDELRKSGGLPGWAR